MDGVQHMTYFICYKTIQKSKKQAQNSVVLTEVSQLALLLSVSCHNKITIMSM